MSTTPSSLRYTLAALVPCIVWSSAVLVMHHLSAPFGPVRGAGLEYGIAGIILSGIGFFRGTNGRIWSHSSRCLFVCGTFWFLNVTLAWLAFAAAKSSGELLVAGLLNYLWPALTLLLSIPILGKRPHKILAVGLVVTLAGIVVGKVATASTETAVDAFSRINPVCYSLAILAAIAWALYSNLARKLSNPEGASAVPLYMVVTGVVLLIASSWLAEPYGATGGDWLIMTGWAVGAAVAYLFWDIGMRFGNVVVISTMSMLIPLVSTVITAVASGHGITLPLVGAAALVVFGSDLCRKGVE
jgi:drug/metabolite transporter (DMT)-like permease